MAPSNVPNDQPSDRVVERLLRLVESSIDTTGFPLELYREVAKLLDSRSDSILQQALDRAPTEKAAKWLECVIQNGAYSPVDLSLAPDARSRLMLFSLLVTVTLPGEAAGPEPGQLDQLRFENMSSILRKRLPLLPGDVVYLADRLVRPESVARTAYSSARQFSRNLLECLDGKGQSLPPLAPERVETFVIEDEDGFVLSTRLLIGAIIGSEKDLPLRERFWSIRSESITEDMQQELATALEQEIAKSLPADPDLLIEVCPSIQPLQSVHLQASAMRAVTSTTFALTPFLEDFDQESRSSLFYRLVPTGFAEHTGVRLEILSSQCSSRILFSYKLNSRPGLDNQEGMIQAMEFTLVDEGIAPFIPPQQEGLGGKVLSIT